MELTSRMKMTRFQTFWIQMRKNKSLDESRKTCQTSGTKMTFYSFFFIRNEDFYILMVKKKGWYLRKYSSLFLKRNYEFYRYK
ncbi:hypothetical protein Hanom_Chr16g01428421 [Helianthus anomalus]